METAGIKLVIGAQEEIAQMEFLLGEKLPMKIRKQMGRLVHLTFGNEWVMNVLEAMGKKVSDIKYPEDREVLTKLFKKDKRYKHLF
jgi:hypothetical protein